MKYRILFGTDVFGIIKIIVNCNNSLLFVNDLRTLHGSCTLTLDYYLNWNFAPTYSPIHYKPITWISQWCFCCRPHITDRSLMEDQPSDRASGAELGEATTLQTPAGPRRSPPAHPRGSPRQPLRRPLGDKHREYKPPVTQQPSIWSNQMAKLNLPAIPYNFV